jgi:hypothetical protein
MTFVKWGIEMKPKVEDAKSYDPFKQWPESDYTFIPRVPQITTEVCIDGVPVKKYQDMANDRKDLIRALRRLLSALDDMNAHGAAYDEAKHLLARMGESND